MQCGLCGAVTRLGLIVFNFSNYYILSALLQIVTLLFPSNLQLFVLVEVIIVALKYNLLSVGNYIAIIMALVIHFVMS